MGPTGVMGLQFTAVYALTVKDYMKRTGAIQEDFARVVARNSYKASLNPNVQYKVSHTIEEIINSRLICWPLTLYMCGPMSDGAAAVVLCAKDVARKYTDKPVVTIESCELVSRSFRYPYPEYFTFPSGTEAAKRAYEKAGIRS